MTDAGGAADIPPLRLEPCPHCGSDVPPGSFCGRCGAELAATAAGGSRLHSYVAAPHEHVLRPSVVSTLFPHLPRRHAHTFQLVLAAGVLLALLLAGLRLLAPATVVAAALIPVLYLLYLYEVEVYEHEPVLVILVTFVAGAGLGVAYSLVTAQLVQPGPLVSAVAQPVVAQLLMAAPPLVLLTRAHFDETLDGLAFGAAGALGFTMASVLSGYWHVLTAPLLSGVSTDDVFRLLKTGVLAAVVNASTTGLVLAAVWSRAHRVTGARHTGAAHDVAASTVVAFVAQIGLGLAAFYVPSLVAEVVVYAVVAALLLVWLRVVLHHALLDEAAGISIGPVSACGECHRLVPTMAFCPACGAARSATPKHARAEGMRPVAPREAGT